VNYELTKVNNDLTKIKESLATVSGIRLIGDVRNNGTKKELKKLEYAVSEMNKKLSKS